MPTLLRGRPQPRNSSDDPEEFRATLGEHLEELRDRIIRSVFILVAAVVAGWFLQPYLYKFLNEMATKAIQPALPKGVQYVEAFHSATEPFMLTLRLAFMIGIIIAMPFLVLQLWGFIAPGLKKGEREPVQKLAPVSVILFAMGAGFCWLVLPAAFQWFASFVYNYQGANLFQEPGTLVFFALKMMAAFGIAFQLPLLVYLLGRMGLLSADTMIRYWRQAIVVIFFASAVITPGGDPFSMIMMGLPLIVLFVISVWAVKVTVKPDRLRDSELDELD